MYNCTNNIAQKRPFEHFVTHNGTIVKIGVNNEIKLFIFFFVRKKYNDCYAPLMGG